MTPFSFSILNFLKTGYIGPLCLSLTSAEVIRILGAPQMLFYSRERGVAHRYLVWKYGSLHVIFGRDKAVRKIVLHPVRPGQFLNLPEAITSVSGYPRSDLSVWHFELYAEHNKLKYFVFKTSWEPMHFTVEIDRGTKAFFTRTGLKSLSISNSPYH